jgi:hypothetical protein
VWIRPALRFINYAGHDEDEDRQVQDRGDYLLIAADEAALLREALQNFVREEQPKCAQDPEERSAFAGDRRQEGQDCGNIGERGRVDKVLEAVLAADEPGGEVGEDDEADRDIDRLQSPVARQERGADDKSHRQQIEGEQAEAKSMRLRRVGLVKEPHPFYDPSDHRVAPNE